MSASAYGRDFQGGLDGGLIIVPARSSSPERWYHVSDSVRGQLPIWRSRGDTRIIGDGEPVFGDGFVRTIQGGGAASGAGVRVCPTVHSSSVGWPPAPRPCRFLHGLAICVHGGAARSPQTDCASATAISSARQALRINRLARMILNQGAIQQCGRLPMLEQSPSRRSTGRTIIAI